jgi:hypothetical protein
MGLTKRGKHFLRRVQTRLLVERLRRQKTHRLRPGSGAVRLVLFLSRPQDVDLYLDIFRQARQRPEIRVVFWATRRALEHFPAMPARLAEYGIEVSQVVDHHNLSRIEERLFEIDALLNTVESSYAAHKVPHRLVQLANACGVMTYTLQHGFENLGLTYLDDEQGSGVTFAARRVLCWSRVEDLPGRLAADTRQKCVAVGCPKIAPEKAALKVDSGKPLIAVFEGLHVSRFDAGYRERFFADLERMAKEFSGLRFLLKPHPGIVQRDSDHQSRLDALAKMIEVLDPARPESGRNRSTPELLSCCRAAITTPSTIALDAAQAGIPVAVIRYGQEIPYYDLYRPLPLLDTTADWRQFLELCERDPQKVLTASGDFLNRVMLPGNAARRILDLVVADCRGDGWLPSGAGLPG